MPAIIAGSTYGGTLDATAVGNGTDNNADQADGEPAYPSQGTADNTNDFGSSIPLALILATRIIPAVVIRWFWALVKKI